MEQRPPLADRGFLHSGTTFRWDEPKAAQNFQKHGIDFEEAATVFDDPVFILLDPSRDEEHRDAMIGISGKGRLLIVVHIKSKANTSESISARRASTPEEAIYAE